MARRRPAIDAADDDPSLPERVFSPPRPVVIGTLVAALVFAVVLDFLVIISFIGQRMWNDQRLLRDLVYSLPLLLWVLVLICAVIFALRILTSWLQVDENGVCLKSLFRKPVQATWDEVGSIIAVRDIDRGTSPAEMLDAPETAYDGVYVMDPQGKRLLAVSSRFFGPRAQRTTLARARDAGVTVKNIDVITPSALRKQVPQALTFADRHPNLLLGCVILFYLAQNILTFAIWGL